jgi:hypothetical protein
MTHVVTLSTPYSRTKAHMLIDKAPSGYVCRVEAPKRTGDQNDKLWAMLTDVSRSKPQDRRMTPDQWKAVFMSACGYEVQFLNGLDGQPFPAGFRSSRLSKSQMSELIEFIQAWGDENGVRWTEGDCA